jgi:aromatase
VGTDTPPKSTAQDTAAAPPAVPGGGAADAGDNARSAEHVTELAAPATLAYRLIEDVGRWPLLFAPCVWAQELERTGRSQRIRLWAVVGDGVRSWTSRRLLDAEQLRVGFTQERPAPPLTAMGGHWRFADGTPGLLELAHHWSTAGDAYAADLIAKALDANSTVEIAAVRAWAERAETPEELTLAFEDEELIAAPAQAVYALLHRAERWPELLPHVAAVDVETAAAEEATGGAEVQTMDMHTSARDGSTHRTQSIRLCFAGERIVYKQTSPPRGLLAHTGEWVVSAVPEGTRVRARHTLVLDPEARAEVFGAETGNADALARARGMIGANSLATLRAVRERLEGGAGE